MNEETVIAWTVVLCVVLGVTLVIRKRRQIKDSKFKIEEPGKGDSQARFCPRCHFRGRTKWRVKGTFAVELLLYLLFILPGIAYTIWRVTNKYTVCPECGEMNMVPVTSPRSSHP